MKFLSLVFICTGLICGGNAVAQSINQAADITVVDEPVASAAVGICMSLSCVCTYFFRDCLGAEWESASEYTRNWYSGLLGALVYSADFYLDIFAVVIYYGVDDGDNKYWRGSIILFFCVISSLTTAYFFTSLQKVLISSNLRHFCKIVLHFIGFGPFLNLVAYSMNRTEAADYLNIVLGLKLIELCLESLPSGAFQFYILIEAEEYLLIPLLSLISSVVSVSTALAYIVKNGMPSLCSWGDFSILSCLYGSDFVTRTASFAFAYLYACSFEGSNNYIFYFYGIVSIITLFEFIIQASQAKYLREPFNHFSYKCTFIVGGTLVSVLSCFACDEKVFWLRTIISLVLLWLSRSEITIMWCIFLSICFITSFICFSIMHSSRILGILNEVFYDDPMGEGWESHDSREKELTFVHLLIERGSDLDFKDKNGETALIRASLKGYGFIVERLIGAGANLDLQNEDGDTALIVASMGRMGRESIVQILIENGANLDLQNRRGYTALLRASEQRHDSIVETLIRKGANLDLQDDQGDTALIKVSGERRDSIVEMLIMHHANIDLQNKNGDTALIRASHEGHDSIVEKLIGAGANLNVQDEEGYTALMRASDQGHDSIVEKLIQAGANLDLPNKSRYGSMVFGQLSTNGDNALIAASLKGYDSIVEKLTKAGANLDLKNQAGYTALMRAAEEGHESIVEKLIEGGANLDLLNNGKTTALMRAWTKGRVSIAKKLILAGAKIDLRNRDEYIAAGLFPIKLSNTNHFTEVLETPDVSLIASPDKMLMEEELHKYEEVVRPDERYVWWDELDADKRENIKAFVSQVVDYYSNGFSEEVIVDIMLKFQIRRKQAESLKEIISGSRHSKMETADPYDLYSSTQFTAPDSDEMGHSPMIIAIRDESQSSAL